MTTKMRNKNAITGETKAAVCPNCSFSYTCKLGNFRKRIARIIPGCNHTLCEECIASLGFNTGQVPCGQPGCSTVAGWNNNMDDFIPSVFLLGAVMYQRECQRPPPVDDQLVNFRPVETPFTGEDSGSISCEECLSATAACFCRSCAVNLCSQCFQKIHKNSKILSGHETSPVKSSQFQIKELESLRIGNCRNHPGKRLQYVAEGGANGCDECVIFGKLKGFNVTSLREHNQKIRKDLSNGLQLGKSTLSRIESLHADLTQEVNSGVDKPPDEVVDGIKSHILECHSQLEALEHRLIKKMEDEVREQMMCNVRLAETVSKRLLEVSKLVQTAEKALLDPSSIEYNVDQILKLLSKLKDEPCVIIKNEESVKPTLQIDTNFMEILKTHVNVSDAVMPQMHLAKTNEEPLVFGNPSENKLEPLVTSESPNIITLNNDSTENDENDSILNTDKKVSPLRERTSDANLKTVEHVLSQNDLDYCFQNQNLVYVSHVVSPGKFFIHKVGDMPSIFQLKKSMTDLVLGEIPTEDMIKKGDLIVAKDDKDGHMYRAKVLKADNHAKEYFVQFIDYGNCSYVNLDDMRILPSTLKTSPFAEECALDGLIPTSAEKMANNWSPDSIELFEQLTSKDFLHILKMGEDGAVSQVDLCIQAPPNDVIGNQVSIREVLVFRNLASFTSEKNVSHPVDSITEESRRSKFFRHDKLEKGKRYNVVVSHVVDLSQFSVQVMQVMGEDRIWENCLEELFEDMQDAYNVDNGDGKWSILAPKVGMVCAARFSKDGKYYRAEVVALLYNQQVRVHFVDFGNSEDIDWSNLRMLFKRFAKFPALSICVALNDVHPFGGTSFSQESTEALKQMTKCKELIMHVEENEEEDNPVKVVLYETMVEKDICINGWIVDKGYAKSTTGLYKQVEYIKVDPGLFEKFENNFRKESESKKKSVQERAKDLIIKKINEGNRKSCHFKVTHVVSPSRIFVRNVDDAERISLLNSRLTSWAKTCSFVAARPWIVGACCAVMQDDQTWARAKIIDLKQNESTMVATVYFYDVGKAEAVNVRDLNILPEKFKEDPPFAKQTHLSDISPTGGTLRWSASACEKLKDLLEPVDDIVKLKKEGDIVIDTDHGINSQPVQLFIVETTEQGPVEPVKEKEVSLSSKLIDNGLALPVKNSNSTVKQALMLKENIGLNVKLIEMEKMSGPQSQLENLDEAVPNFASNEETDEVETKVEWEDAKKLELKEFTGMATHVDWNCNIYLQTSENQENLRLIKEILNSKYSGSVPKPPDHYWYPGQCCILQFTLDGNWCRGRVIKCVESGVFEVEYVDYGNTEFVTPNEMRKTLFVQNLPVQCFKLQLAGLTPSGNSDQWSKKVLDFIHGLIVDQSLKVNIESEMDKGFPVFGSLSTLAGVDIAELLVKNGYAKWEDIEESGYSKKTDRGDGGYSKRRDRGDCGYAKKTDRGDGGYLKRTDRGDGGYSKRTDRGDCGYAKKTDMGDGSIICSEHPRIGSTQLDQTQVSLESDMGLSVPPDDFKAVNSNMSVLPDGLPDVNSNLESGDHTTSVSVWEACTLKSLSLPYKIGDDFLVKCLIQTSVDSFYCHLFASEDNNVESLVTLSSNLQAHGDQQPLVQDPQIGMAVIALCKRDRKWRRAVVLNCHPTSVLFVDFGNSQQVDEVRSLPTGMDRLPKQAVLLRVVPAAKFVTRKSIVSQIVGIFGVCFPSRSNSVSPEAS